MFFCPLIVTTRKDGFLRSISCMKTSFFRSLTMSQAAEEEASIRPEWPWKKAKKSAVMLSFSGKNYTGMQRNHGFPTIEEELLKAMRDVGTIAPEWYDNPSKGFFQRASRTDKGVSASKMVVSLKMLHETDTIDKINEKLPSEIRIQAIKRVTKNFNSKNSCDARTYLYVIPTLAFTPIEDVTREDFRITPELKTRINNVFKLYIGPHYFHNYTSGKLPMEPSAQRFITDFEIGEPFVKEGEGLEFAVIRIKGQSFMLHQIRKMIGMAIAVVKGYASESVIEDTWGMQRIDIPRAPGLGLLLEEVHYERYNFRFGKDGMHEPLLWDDVEENVRKFKDEFIFADIIETEKSEKSMLTWLSHLTLHKFEPRHFENEGKIPTPLERAKSAITRERSKESESSSILVTASDSKEALTIQP